MSDAFDQEIVLCFLDEAVDALVAWERACLDLEKRSTPETFSALFRAAHNLKGSSRAVGLESFGEFVHQVEDLIQLLMKGTLELTPSRLSLLLECQVVLLGWTEELRKDSGYVPDLRDMPARLVAAQSEVLATAVSKPCLRSSSPELKTSGTEDLEAIFAAAQEQYHQASLVPVVPQGGKPQSPLLSPANGKSEASDHTTGRSRSDETVRVAASKLDELIQLIGELSIHQAIVYQAKREGNLEARICQNAIHLSNKITKDIHSKALSLRMQPVQGLFQRLERVARDVARLQGKRVEIQVEGSEVELDKSVIERITDPLIHILRNAIDHGIETPEQRHELGKPDAIVLLSGIQDATGVTLKVADNGRGLNTARILKKARERGIVNESQSLTDEEIHQLIFLPGFSTAEEVTDISGRGVGMDVVMKAVQALQGSINISSVEGKGTTFSITLPTSLSIVDALVVTVDDARYAVPMHELTEIIDLDGYSIDTTGNRGRMLSLRGQVVPLAPLKTYISVSKGKGLAQKEVKEGGKPALIVREAGELMAFEIDSIVGQQQIVVRPLSEQLASLKGFNGCTILGDGEPGMIISLGEIARTYFRV